MSHVHRGKSRPAPAPRAHSAPPSPQRRRIMWLIPVTWIWRISFELQHMINPPGPVAPLPPEVVQAIDQGGAVAVGTGAVKFCHNNWILLPDGRFALPATRVHQESSRLLPQAAKSMIEILCSDLGAAGEKLSLLELPLVWTTVTFWTRGNSSSDWWQLAWR